MKKTETTYYFLNKMDDLTVKVNEDATYLDYKPLFVEYSKCWRKPEEAIEFYKFVIKSLEELK